MNILDLPSQFVLDSQNGEFFVQIRTRKNDQIFDIVEDVDFVTVDQINKLYDVSPMDDGRFLCMKKLTDFDALRRLRNDKKPL